MAVLRVLRSELGKERADAIVKQALRDWSKQLFAAVGNSVDGSPRRKWAAMHATMADITEQEVTVEMRRKRWNSMSPTAADIRKRARGRGRRQTILDRISVMRPSSS